MAKFKRNRQFFEISSWLRTRKLGVRLPQGVFLLPPQNCPFRYKKRHFDPFRTADYTVDGKGQITTKSPSLSPNVNPSVNPDVNPSGEPITTGTVSVTLWRCFSYGAVPFLLKSSHWRGLWDIKMYLGS